MKKTLTAIALAAMLAVSSAAQAAEEQDDQAAVAAEYAAVVDWIITTGACNHADLRAMNFALEKALRTFGVETTKVGESSPSETASTK